MAGSQQALSFQEVAACSICLEFFTDPVCLDCGHSFCRSCITRSWEGAGADPPCPQCRSQGRNLRPNRELGAIVELVKLKISPTLSPQEEGLCPRHLQRLQLFCAEDHTLLCVVCRESRVHKPHTVSPQDEAAQEYRDTLQRHREQLSSELQGLEQQRTGELRTAAELEENFKNQTERVCKTFEILREYLEREKRALLGPLEEEHQENMKKIRGALAHLEEQLTTHRDLVAALEVKCGQRDVELLADVQDILSRCESMRGQSPEGDREMDQNTQSLGQQDPLQEKIMEIKERFAAELEWSYAKGFERALFPDLDTALQRFLPSVDGESSEGLGHSNEVQQKFEQRFFVDVIFLAKQRLSSGRHYWEVDVDYDTDWSVGVCDGSVCREGLVIFDPKIECWFVGFCDGEHVAYTSPCTVLTPRAPLKRVGVFLDYEAGRLSVYNVADRSLLFTFSGVSFPSILRPVFTPKFRQTNKPKVSMWTFFDI